MAVSSVRKNYSYLFGILVVMVYFVGLLIVNRGLGFKNALVIVGAMILYYVANVFNVYTSKYRLRDMIIVTGINVIISLATIFLKIFNYYEGIIIFGIMAMFQIAFRYIVITGLVGRQRIMFVGENGYTNDLLESIKVDEQYKLIGFLKNIITLRLFSLISFLKVL